MNLVLNWIPAFMLSTGCWLSQSICPHSLYVLVILDKNTTITVIEELKNVEEGTVGYFLRKDRKKTQALDC